MRLRPDCLPCLYNQTLRLAKVAGCDEECSVEVLHEGAKFLAELPLDRTPPQAAAELYPMLSRIIGTDDPYQEQKLRSIQKAKELLPWVEQKLKESEDPLKAALRAAVAGNVIDFATQVSFDLEEEVRKIFQVRFAIDEMECFIQRLQKVKELVVIGDNTGEHLFDKLMIQVFRRNFPDLHIYYFVRGRPIINDVTLEEAKMVGMDEVCEVVDSGVDTPGFLMERANKRARRIYQEADLILAKGMGNFECMESYEDARLFFLFKVKCSVVAARTGCQIGDLLCANQQTLKEAR